MLWIVELCLNIREGCNPLRRIVWDSSMRLGYGDVGVTLLDPDSGVVVWIKLFRRDRVRAVTSGRVAGLFLIILLNNILAGCMYG